MILPCGSIHIFDMNITIWIDSFIEPTLTRCYIRLHDFKKAIGIKNTKYILIRYRAGVISPADFVRIYLYGNNKSSRKWFLTLDGAIAMAEAFPAKIRTYRFIEELKKFKSYTIAHKNF